LLQTQSPERRPSVLQPKPMFLIPNRSSSQVMKKPRRKKEKKKNPKTMPPLT
jgi:hypothetical protein